MAGPLIISILAHQLGGPLTLATGEILGTSANGKDIHYSANATAGSSGES
jgi:hypothetical protein